MLILDLYPNDKLKNECKIKNENKQGWTSLIIRGLTEIKLIILSSSKISYCVKKVRYKFTVGCYFRSTYFEK